MVDATEHLEPHRDPEFEFPTVGVGASAGELEAVTAMFHKLRAGTGMAVVFLVKDRLSPVIDEYAVAPHTRDRRIADLQEELQSLRVTLKSKVKEIETANEELKSSNEEMMSMNEELQSANEKLTTANEELKNKIDKLTVANADLDNFVQSADIAMIVLDRAMRIRHVTQAAQQVVPVLSTDKGRMMSEFNIRFRGFDLLQSISQLLETGQAVTQPTDVDDDGRAFFVRVMPYFFRDLSVEGVTITILDVSEETRLRKSLEVEPHRLKMALSAGRMGLSELDVDSREMTFDAVSANQFGFDEEGTRSLATNSLKYGALSKSDGAIHISWDSTASGRVTMKWAEKVSGFEGHEIKKGFGSQLIESGLQQLEGRLESEMTDLGMKFDLVFKIDHAGQDSV